MSLRASRNVSAGRHWPAGRILRTNALDISYQVYIQQWLLTTSSPQRNFIGHLALHEHKLNLLPCVLHSQNPAGAKSAMGSRSDTTSAINNTVKQKIPACYDIPVVMTLHNNNTCYFHNSAYLWTISVFSVFRQFSFRVCGRSCEIFLLFRCFHAKDLRVNTETGH